MYLYVHIPFCKSKCSYCDFFSVPLADNAGVPDSYIEAVLQEAAFRKKLHGIREWSSMYAGGGTPGLLSVGQLKRLFSGLFALCPPTADAEITLEVNCADIAEKNVEGFCPYLEAACEAGVNRISAGIQTFSDRSLHAVGRRSCAAQVKGALENLKRWREKGNASFVASDSACVKSRSAKREKGRLLLNMRRFSCDLIAGLPFLSTDDFCAGVRELIRHNPDHISLYALMCEEGTPLERQIAAGLIEYSSDLSDEQWLLGRNMLEKAGYRQYEVSNFAKAGFESAHNCAYWRMKDYIGLGAAAVGTVGDIRYTGTRDIKAYTDFWTDSKKHSAIRCTGSTCACGAYTDTNAAALADCTEKLCVPESISATEYISKDDAITEFLMMGFRMLQGISAAEFKKRFGCNLLSFIEPVFSRWQKRGLAETDGETYRLTKEGILFLNEFLTEIVSAIF